MPARKDLKSICVLGSGPIVIGQAAEFDYSGTQAVKALRQEGYRVVLVNSNPATIMTDPDFADATYIEPLTVEVVAKILEKEKPDALLPTVGGQTALNLAMDLEKEGVLKRLGIELIGAEVDVIDKAENRQLFKAAMAEIGLETAKSWICHSWEDAQKAREDLGLPVVIRPSFTLGGSGGGIAKTEDEFETIVRNGLLQSPTTEILLEESILGWKEYEFEVMRDTADNVVIICSIENLDPMGVHTGDSITVAPAQTLTDKEYQVLRDASIEVMREIGVKTGGSNVQFAVNPENGRVVVIEMNPRVSRSSALASKATGYPIAKMAAKVAVGYTLDEIVNDITLKTKAAFEPALDYVVVKVPRFAFEKFAGTPRTLTTQMRSVGEAMAIGRTFQESLSKALRSLEHGVTGIEAAGITKAGGQPITKENLMERLATPSPERLWIVVDALRRGMSIKEVYAATGGIDPWFLAQMQEMVETEKNLQSQASLEALDYPTLMTAKKMGFGDAEIGSWYGVSEAQARSYRQSLNIKPVFKRIDTCAAEFEAHTPYLYSCYETPFHRMTENGVELGEACESEPTNGNKIIILGGGPIRIGQGIEFDYCCVQASYALRDAGFETIMVNCNPETVSTDYDTSDRLYFEPLTFENVMDIVEKEKPMGLIVQFGGQTPLKLAEKLHAAGVPILGTTTDAIDRAEDRERSNNLIVKVGLNQPESGIATCAQEAFEVAKRIGYPLLLRPSYVLGGRAMERIHSDTELERYLNEAMQATEDRPLLLDRFLSGAIELDVDCLCDGEDVIIGGVMQHVEEAGVHSGDSSCVTPPHTLSALVVDEICRASRAIALELGVRGLMNAQFAVQRDRVYVIEVNPRASRTVPFVSKATGLPLARLASRVMAGAKIKDLQVKQPPVHRENVPYVSVKAAVLPFIKFPGTDTLLGPEMRSTGEVMGLAENYAHAFAKSQLSAGNILPSKGCAFISVADVDKEQVLSIAQRLYALGFQILSTGGTNRYLERNGVYSKRVNKVVEGSPHILDSIEDEKVDLVINTTVGTQSIEDSKSLRRASVNKGLPYYTTLPGALAAIEAMEAMRVEDVYSVASLQSLLDKRESTPAV